LRQLLLVVALLSAFAVGWCATSIFCLLFCFVFKKTILKNKIKYFLDILFYFNLFFNCNFVPP